MFSKLLQEYEKFSNSDPSSVEYQVYQRRKMITMAVEDVIELSPGMAFQKVIVVGREVFVDGAAIATLMNARIMGFPDVRMLRAQEKDAKKFTNGLIWNRNANEMFRIETQRLYVSKIFNVMDCKL